MNLRFPSLRVLLAGIASLLSAAAQAATLAGAISDSVTRRFVLGASVTLRETGHIAVTDSSGRYVFHDLAPGRYTLVVDSIGYQPATQSVGVSDNDTPRMDFVLSSDVATLGKFVVEGDREGSARALQQKRTADNIIDVVSSDSAGKLPDGNAAEAVRRLPGVYAEIDQNEGRYIVVRGIDANLNNITINGVSVGSPEAGGRGAGMDGVPADLISRIEVVKAVTSDMDHQAIGASVNIVTPSAFDRSGTFAYGTLASGYYDGPRGDFTTNRTTPASGSATYGTTFGGGKWGFVVGGSYSFRHYISERRSGGNPWYPAAAGSNVTFPAEEALFHYDVQRWREGWNAALEFRPSEKHQFAFRVSDNRFRDEEGREQNAFEFFRTAFPASFTPTTATFTGGRSTVEYRYYKQKHNITNVSFAGKHLLADGWRVDYNVAGGDAAKKTPDRQDWEFRSGTTLASSIDIAPEYWIINHPANFYDAATFPFRRVRFRKDREYEENASAVVNLRRDQKIFGFEGYWQVGGKYFRREKVWNRTNVDYLAGTGANLFNLSQFNVSRPGRTMFDGRVKMSPQIDLRAMQAFFRDSANARYFVFNSAGTLSNSNVTDFGMEEDITAAYAMSRVNFGSLSVLAGLRTERSSGDVTQTELPTASSTALAPRLNHFSTSYTNTMPGVHLRYAATKNWLWRASWTNTLGRPNYPDMAGAATFVYSPDPAPATTYTGSISSGNSGLKPFESRNLDLTTEYYLKGAGILSIGFFDKEVKNPVFTNAYTLRNTTYAGLAFSSLAYSRPENAASGKIHGIEFNYQQQLTMLPGALNGLGFSLNYTKSDSEERLFTRPTESLRFAKQADQLYNVALFYEKYGVQARVAYSFTGDFIKAFGSDVNSDQYQAERKIIDAKISYRLSQHFTIFSDIINLGAEPLDEYAGYSNRNGATEAYWWTANFGVNWKL